MVTKMILLPGINLKVFLMTTIWHFDPEILFDVNSFQSKQIESSPNDFPFEDSFGLRKQISHLTIALHSEEAQLVNAKQEIRNLKQLIHHQKAVEEEADKYGLAHI